MSTLKVDGIRSNSATSDAITLASDGTCTANITNRSNRNLIINGAMQVAQRGTSSTSNGYHTVDRWLNDFGGVDETATQAQVDVASGTTPYTLGFRKSLKWTNGNQTSGAGAGDYIGFSQKIEAQDIANSGWNYTSASSYVTLSFWIKSSVAQNFYGYLHAQDGTAQNYPFETGSLSADTWTKITKVIPGNSNLTFDNDNGVGLQLQLWAFIGTTYTGTVTLNQWAAFASGTRTPNNTSTWYTTNDATLEITGVQLEVGSFSSDFQFKSFAEELALCQRYYLQYDYHDQYEAVTIGINNNAGQSYGILYFPTTMRTAPTQTESSVGHFRVNQGASDEACNDITTENTSNKSCMLVFHKTTENMTSWEGAIISADNNDDASLFFSAEL
jgi:hypothetical protein